MRKKQDFALDVMSGIDDDIIDKNLKKRFELWFSRGKKPKNNRWMTILASAACFLLAVTIAILLWPNAPVDEKQAPVYLGMTLSNDAPVVSARADDVGTYDRLSLPIGSNALKANPIFLSGNNGNNGNHYGNTKNNNGTTPEITGGPYYAMPGEDIYIYVHISNPDKFEILSFTLNEVKYSSYMFEDGSDLETLILKCNVGDIEGVMQYTIDAIKYVDGEEIKDVKMDGERTIEVMVGRAESFLGFDILLTGFDVNITPIWKEDFEGTKEILSLGVYDGETLIRELAITDRVIKGLPSNSRFVLVATYKNGEEIETARYIFDTRKLSEGLLMSSGYIIGIGTCQDTVLYLDAPIGEEAFLNNKYITEVHFGPNVTSICDHAFAECVGLTEFTVPDSVTSIGKSTFRGCTGLTSISIPDSVTSIDDLAFAGCVGLTEVFIPDTVSQISGRPFVGCSNIKKATIPSNAIPSIPKINLETLVITGGETIHKYALQDCINLKTLVIPASITSIGEGALMADNIVLEGDNTAYTLVDDCLIEISTNKLIWGGENGVISNDVTSIGAYAFAGRENLTNVIIPGGVTSIGDSAFSDCTGLTSVTILGGVISIGDSSFSGCENLESINIPRGVTNIGKRAFCECVALKEITIPNTVTTIGEFAFLDCYGLENITIEENTGFTTSGSDTIFGFSYGRETVNIQTITVPISAWKYFVSIAGLDFQEVNSIDTVILTDTDARYTAPMVSMVLCVKNLVIEEGVTRLTRQTLDICSFDSITIPQSVIQIDTEALYDVSIGSIKYEGTTEQWEAITKADNWITSTWATDNPIPSYVQCTDGTVALR